LKNGEHHNACQTIEIAVIASVALFFSFIVFNNLTDFPTNHWCVSQVLSMEGIRSVDVKWRAIHQPQIQIAAYLLIIIIEACIALLCWISIWMALRDTKTAPQKFLSGKPFALLGLTSAFMLFFVGFVVIGGEWFYMWQHPILNNLQVKAAVFSLVMWGSLTFISTDIHS
jgi:predicted small integral membrane protein